MSVLDPKLNSHRRASSGSTVKVTDAAKQSPGRTPIRANLWIHDDHFSPEDILINESILEGSDIREGSLVEIFPVRETSDVRDFQSPNGANDRESHTTGASIDSTTGIDRDSRYLCIAKFAQAEFKAKQAGLEISIKNHIASAFGLRPQSRVLICSASFDECTASHVELGFRDAYLSRSDMWRMVGQELAGRTVYTSQKITFLGTIKATVKSIHVHGHKVSTAFFSGTTIPVFRSEAARYVLFIQMSSEMWDFDSEGNGEILFNRVINGFLPDLFKRWSQIEVRHLVSIVLFGRLEYDGLDFARDKEMGVDRIRPSAFTGLSSRQYEDFYRVVVTDMASVQWTTILDQLKKDFRVFLRDISLHKRHEDIPLLAREDGKNSPARIVGRPSTALKGNILEAINIAASQFANDNVDRDLIRTGISVAVITAGTGVFEVDRNLLNLTSENLTNNGIGIDVVCLSKMPLHSVPLFKYRNPVPDEALGSIGGGGSGNSPHKRSLDPHDPSWSNSRKLSPALSSFTTNSTRYLSNVTSILHIGRPDPWCYGIPQWIDLSYWSPETGLPQNLTTRGVPSRSMELLGHRKGPFVPRVRMYEIQMMGVMELGLADMSIPFMTETQSSKFHRRRRLPSTVKHTSQSRNMSQSPAMSRRSRIIPALSQPSQGLLSTHAKALGDIFDRMDDYDSAIFRHRPRPRSPHKPTSLPLSSAAREAPNKKNEERTPHSVIDMNRSEAKPRQSDKAQIPAPLRKPIEGSPRQGAGKKNPEAARAVRNLSYALRGLAPPVRAAPSTEVNIMNAQAEPRFSSPTHPRPTVKSPGSIGSASLYSASGDHDIEVNSLADRLSIRKSPLRDETPSKPISINGPGRQARGESVAINFRAKARAENGRDGKTGKIGATEHRSYEDRGSESSSQSPSDEEEEEERESHSAHQPDYISVASSVPQSVLPFVRNVNASNPLKRHPEKVSLFGRWQHLYPRKPRASTVKWRSLCTPAAVPLTTEDFPSKQEFESEYENTTYDICLGKTNDVFEVPKSRDTLLREMLSLRFAHGYQLVVGSRLHDAVGPGSCDPSYFFNPDLVRPDGQFIFMSMGNTIQKLSLLETDHIHVTRYVRNPQTGQSRLPSRINYSPNIKTILAGTYNTRDMELKGFSEQYPWEVADGFLADPKKQLAADVNLLRFWRARFVLIPVQPPANAWRLAPSDSEENEEEIHLRGIRALTQMWQKNRYIPPDERRPGHNRLSTIKKKDRNPLRINLETLNPSELVATELDKLLAAEEAGEGQSTQLLPEADQFERETVTLSKLAQAIQGEKGIEIKNRRWHLRLHYSCFQGEEFTNWLVLNFRDIDTREEAVEFGNELMKEGLFEHVNSRHNFKDGNYFYSLKSDWRIQRPDPRQAWFPGSRRSDKSVPPTPLNEHPIREALPGRSRSGSSLATQSNVQSTSELTKTLGEKKKRTVSLSKMIRIDVDHRKRSDRPEIVDLHYDRIHNPENCYHLELAWLNVTSKLVDDAIVAWTTQAEKYGLKLVEVPIAEACRVPENEPFRAPYRIRLVSEPPRRPSSSSVAGNVYFTATSFGPQALLHSDVHLYQKALLKRFNFVLDIEAVSEFPENVEIEYSWGKLDYRYTQFVHRSGVVLAQITDEGDILVLGNRLYNSRLVSTKDNASKFDAKKDHPAPSVQASVVMGLNVQSPSLGPVGRTPLIGATADVIVSRQASGFTSYITPRQVKDELEAFCRDKEKLEAFYREITTTPPVVLRRPGSTTSSTVLEPIREPDAQIPEFRLPEAVAVPKRKNTS